MNGFGIRRSRGQYKSNVDPLLVELKKPQFVCKHPKTHKVGFPGDFRDRCAVCRKWMDKK